MIQSARIRLKQAQKTVVEFNEWFFDVSSFGSCFLIADFNIFLAIES